MDHRLLWIALAVVALLSRLATPLHIITETPSQFARAATSDTPRVLVSVHDDGSKVPKRKPEELLLSSYRVMTDAAGKRYVCTMPPPLPPQAAPIAKVEEAQTIKTPFELLESLTALCLYRQEGLWTYEMCYRKHARQFREGSQGKGEDFSCGKYTGDEAQSEEIKFDASSSSEPIKYVSHIMKGGAPCVMTGEGRTAEIRFTCMRDVADNTIVSVKEFPTCNYVFTVATVFLCRHPEFKPKPEIVRAISCVPETVHQAQLQGAMDDGHAAAAPSPAQRQEQGGCKAPPLSADGALQAGQGQCGNPEAGSGAQPEVVGMVGEGKGEPATGQADMGQQLLPDEMPFEPDVNPVEVESLLEKVKEVAGDGVHEENDEGEEAGEDEGDDPETTHGEL